MQLIEYSYLFSATSTHITHNFKMSSIFHVHYFFNNLSFDTVLLY